MQPVIIWKGLTANGRALAAAGTFFTTEPSEILWDKYRVFGYLFGSGNIDNQVILTVQSGVKKNGEAMPFTHGTTATSSTIDYQDTADTLTVTALPTNTTDQPSNNKAFEFVVSQRKGTNNIIKMVLSGTAAKMQGVIMIEPIVN